MGGASVTGVSANTADCKVPPVLTALFSPPHRLDKLPLLGNSSPLLFPSHHLSQHKVLEATIMHV